VHYPPFAHNPLRSRADVQRAMLDLWHPLRPHFVRDGPAVSFGDTEADYGTNARMAEAFLRPLWGLAPLLAGGCEVPDFDVFPRGLAAGCDPTDARYWGPCHDRDQRFVEMAPLALALMLVPEHVFAPLDSSARRDLVAWLSAFNRHLCPDNNWLFFRVLANLGLRSVGAEFDEARLAADLQRLDAFYKGDGWYHDGDRPRRDYYVPMVMHYCGLLYARHHGESEPTRAAEFRHRAALFAPQFAAWFAADGSAIPYGRSMTYRFAQCAFWGALAYSGVAALPWGQIKGLYLRNLRWWARQPIFTETGLLSIGYRYPNLIMAEAYNAPGSPYFACAAFLPLALPETHDFWQASEEECGGPAINVQPKAGMVVCRDDLSGHLFALSNNRAAAYPPRHSSQKYSKFAYSTAFGFGVPVGGTSPERGGCDNMLMLTDDGLDWRVRDEFRDESCAGSTLYTIWLPWPDVEVQTWLSPALPGHVRAHCIRTRRKLWSFEGGFAASMARSGNGRSSMGPGMACADLGNAFAGIRDLSTAPRRGAIARDEPNTNLLWPLTLTPGLSGEHPPGEIWLLTAVVAIPGAGRAEGGNDFLARLALDRTGPFPRIVRGGEILLECQVPGSVSKGL
jgi:hypothetical protein